MQTEIISGRQLIPGKKHSLKQKANYETHPPCSGSACDDNALLLTTRLMDKHEPF